MFRNIIAAVMMLASFSMLADDSKSFSKHMNEIKRSGAFVYAEASAATIGEATEACNELLKIEITKYLSNDGENKRIIKNLGDYNCRYLTQPRGEVTRVFGFVAKSDIEAAAKKPEEPAPAVVTPPVKEEPRKEEPVKEEPKPKLKEPEPPVTVVSNLVTTGLRLAKWQVEMLESIAKEREMFEAKKLMNRYKTQNRIKRLGDRNVTNPRPEDSFYMVYDASGAPAALLAPSESNEHLDMISGSTVNFQNYSGNQYLWFQISK